jgi:hypothetical protein
MNRKLITYPLAAVFFFATGFASLIYFSYNLFLQALGSLGSWAVFAIVAYNALTTIPAFQGIAAWISRGMSFWKTGERATVALTIEKDLNSAQEEINKEAEGLLPYPATVEWVNKPSYIDTEEEVAIIRMKEHKHNPRNVAFAVIDYISKGMIPFSRLYVEKPIQTAVDSTMVKKILLERNKAALDYFLTNILNKKLDEEGVRHYMEVVSNLDKHGLLTRIYLEEVKEVGLQIYPDADNYALTETREYLEQLNVLASRRRGERGTANPYIARRVKVAHILIADSEKLIAQGFGPYVEYALHCVEDGAESIYVLSRGRKNKTAIRLARNIALTCRMKIINMSEHVETVDDGSISALCIEMRVDKTQQEQKLET